MKGKKGNLAKRIFAGIMAFAMVLTNMSFANVYADETNETAAFTCWFNTDGSATGIKAGQQGNFPIYAGEDMAGKTNKITVDGVDYYSVQGTNNPKTNGNNPNGAIPTVGAYLKVVAPVDGSITVYGFPASGKSFYATKGDTAALTDGNAFCGDSHSYTVTVKANEEWYFYAQGSKAQFVGVKFELPKATVTIPVEFTGAELGDAVVSFTNEATNDVVSIGSSDTSVTLTEGYKYTVAVNSSLLVIDVTEVDLTNGKPEKIAIAVEEAAKHAVSGSIKGLPEGAAITKLTFTDEAGVENDAVVNGLTYTVDLKNGNYTTTATVTGAEGYIVYDHVAVEGTEGEAIANDVWFYGATKTYSNEYVESLKVGQTVGCDYATITEAIAAAKAMTRADGQYVTLILCDEEYVEQVIVDAANIKMVAAEGVTPTVRWYYGIGYKYYSIDDTGYYNEKNANDKYEMKYAQRWGAVVRIKANGFKAEGIEFVNTFNRYVCDEELGDSKVGSSAEYGQSISGSLEERVKGLDVANATNVERAAAVAIDADEAEFYKCTFISSQDTLYTGSAKSYFNDCLIVGQTDYIFGNTGTKAIFDNCELRWLGYTTGSKEGYVTATRGSYLFRGCKITSSKEDGYTVTSGYFGRPWSADAEVAFVGTAIEENAINATGWKDMSGVTPANVKFTEYGNTVNGANFYSSFASTDATKEQFQITKENANKLADPANDSAYLDTWTPAKKIASALDLSAVADWNTVGKTDDNNQTGDFEERSFTFDAAQETAITSVDKSTQINVESFANGEFTHTGTSKRSNSGTFSLELASNAGSSLSFTIKGEGTVKIRVSSTGGSNVSSFGLYDATGSLVNNTANATTVSGSSATEFSYKKLVAGTYKLQAGPDRGVRVYLITVTDSPKEILISHALDAGELVTETKAIPEGSAVAAENSADGFFSVIYGSGSKVEAKSVEVADFKSSKRINFGGELNAETFANSIKFTTTQKYATVTVYWQAGADGREMQIVSADGKQVIASKEKPAKDARFMTKFNLTEKGTYYLGGLSGKNYVFKTVVEESNLAPKRAAWGEVAAPTIKSAVVENEKIIVTVDGEIGFNGADKVVVSMSDVDGKVVAEASSNIEKKESVLEFVPSASGSYNFVASLIREDEEKKNSNSVSVENFILPLATPILKSATSTGNGTAKVEWNVVAEAEKYIVSVNDEKIEAVETTELSATLKGMAVGTTYTVSVVAVRGEDKSASGTIDVTITEEAQRTWASSRYGSSVDTKNNGVSGSALDGQVTVFSEGGKGKIVPGSTDGLTFYYTVIDPETENFTLTAKVHVDNWTLSNGQEGFGLMAADTVGIDGDGTAFWNNSYQLLASKIEYYHDGESITTDTNANKISMKLGLGYTAKLGVTADDVAEIKKGAITMPAGFITETGTLEDSCARAGSGTYNIVGNYKGAEPTGSITDLVTDFILQIQRNNTGYIMRYLDTDGTVIGEKLYYDLERNELTKIDADHIYLGFFASRNARITATDIKLTTIKPEDDEAALEREIEYVYPNYTIESATTANSEAYDVVYYGNADGVLSIVDNKGNVVVKDKHVEANTKNSFAAKIGAGTTTFTVTFTPDADYVPGEYKKLTTYEPATFTHSVLLKSIGQKNIYVTPNGSANGNGSNNSPVDIYTAVKYAKPGQTIVLAGGVYNLSKTVKVDRGIDGTKDAMIYMVADPNATSRPVFDFGGKCAGMILAGDYWYFQGFDVTRSADAQKGIQVSGNNNVLDQINAYKNGNTGIQISRYLGTDEFEEWPANNLILNCTSYLNADKGYEDADGFAAKLTVGNGNVFDGCIAAYNADDGWDLFAKVQSGSIGAVTIQNSVTFKNGYVLKNEAGELDLNGKVVNAGNGNGFKMGGDSMSGYHVLKNSIAFANKAKGFDSNSCPDIQVFNSTSFDNESYNVAFYTNVAVNTDFAATGVISYKKSNSVSEQFKLLGTQVKTKVYNDTNHFFKVTESGVGVEASDEWFVSLDITNALSLLTNRNADGTINMNGLLELTDKAPANAGARMSGTASKVITVTYEAPISQPQNEQTNSNTQSEQKDTTVYVKPDTTANVIVEAPVSQEIKNITEAVSNAELPVELDSKELSSAIELTNFEKAAGVWVWAEVDALTIEEVPVSDYKAIEEKMNNTKVACYFDLGLFKQVPGQKKTDIKQTKAPVTLSVTLPAEMIVKGRYYAVVRVHDGVYEQISEFVQAVNGEISFKTDAFSTYAVIYTDKPAAVRSPKTGENTNALWLLLFAMGVMCVALPVCRRRFTK